MHYTNKLWEVTYLDSHEMLPTVLITVKILMLGMLCNFIFYILSLYSRDVMLNVENVPK